MRVPAFAIAVVLLSTANTAPLHAQSDEEIILADPAFSLTFRGRLCRDRPRPVAEARHQGEDRRHHRHRRDQLGDLGSSHFAQASASSFGRASARGKKLIAIATTIDRPFAQVVLRKELAEAGG